MNEESAGINSLQELFGSFRAEWLEERLYSLFQEPDYFPTLTDRRPCVLIGGRGTGKTTVLRCMSYHGQQAISGNTNSFFENSEFVGVYLRINTNEVTAFSGDEHSDREWIRCFGHFINLKLGREIIEFLLWCNEERKFTLSQESCNNISRYYGIEETGNVGELFDRIEEEIFKLEIYINNPETFPRPIFSQLQIPINKIIEEVRKEEYFKEKVFYFLIDEYENFLDYQQRIVNTLIKHSGEGYSFKIGVKENGWRIRSTLNDNENLISPADYDRIQIEEALEGNFTAFAKSVCETRLQVWSRQTGHEFRPLTEMLPRLTVEKEAELLGVSTRVAEFQEYLSKYTETKGISNIVAYTFLYFNDGNKQKAKENILDYINKKKNMIDRYENYKYAYLFTIAGKGAEITKYYCGNETFSKISKNNIRFYLQLLLESIALHSKKGEHAVLGPISSLHQTRAARSVGRTYLKELEGVTVQGAQLVKLLLGFGRYFQIMASNPRGRTPECNHFRVKARISADTVISEDVGELLRIAVMHMALVRDSGTKLASEFDYREWEYAIHPIFSPFFNFGHRRKRRIDISESELIGMINQPAQTIRSLLKSPSLYDDTFPIQLKLFENYYTDD